MILFLWQGAYKFGKMKFPELSRFSRPSKQPFVYNYKVKTRAAIRLKIVIVINRTIKTFNRD